MVTRDLLPRWLEALTQDEVRFLRGFLLASGSLKELARQYEVSYPTIRNRLDAVISKVRAADEEEEIGPLRAKVKALVRDGRLEVDIARQILDSYAHELKGNENG